LSSAIGTMTSDSVLLKIVDELHPSVIREERSDIEVLAVFSPLRPGYE
jgi:hypothetical protein